MSDWFCFVAMGWDLFAAAYGVWVFATAVRIRNMVAGGVSAVLILVAVGCAWTGWRGCVPRQGHGEVSMNQEAYNDIFDNVVVYDGIGDLAPYRPKWSISVTPGRVEGLIESTPADTDRVGDYPIHIDDAARDTSHE